MTSFEKSLQQAGSASQATTGPLVKHHCFKKRWSPSRSTVVLQFCPPNMVLSAIFGPFFSLAFAALRHHSRSWTQYRASPLAWTNRQRPCALSLLAVCVCCEDSHSMDSDRPVALMATPILWWESVKFALMTDWRQAHTQERGTHQRKKLRWCYAGVGAV